LLGQGSSEALLLSILSGTLELHLHPWLSQLSKDPRMGAAQGASGKAGGLIAKWSYPKELTEISLEEQVSLAGEYGSTER
jgi:hypothetical protein